MHARASRPMVPERKEGTRRVVYTTLYDLVAAVSDAVEAGEEDLVVPIVSHVLRAGRGHFLRDVDIEMLWDDEAPVCLEEEASCVPA